MYGAAAGQAARDAPDHLLAELLHFFMDARGSGGGASFHLQESLGDGYADLGCVKRGDFAVAADDVIFSGLVGSQFAGIFWERLVAVLSGHLVAGVNPVRCHVNNGLRQDGFFALHRPYPHIGFLLLNAVNGTGQEPGNGMKLVTQG